MCSRDVLSVVIATQCTPNVPITCVFVNPKTVQPGLFIAGSWGLHTRGRTCVAPASPLRLHALQTAKSTSSLLSPRCGPTGSQARLETHPHPSVYIPSCYLANTAGLQPPTQGQQTAPLALEQDQPQQPHGLDDASRSPADDAPFTRLDLRHEFLSSDISERLRARARAL